MEPIAALKAAGFSRQEVAEWLRQAYPTWTAAGFDNEEIRTYLFPGAFLDAFEIECLLGLPAGYLTKCGDKLQAQGFPAPLAPGVRLWEAKAVMQWGKAMEAMQRLPESAAALAPIRELLRERLFWHEALLSPE
jgi:hypothetical protein